MVLTLPPRSEQSSSRSRTRSTSQRRLTSTLAPALATTSMGFLVQQVFVFVFATHEWKWKSKGCKSYCEAMPCQFSEPSPHSLQIFEEKRPMAVFVDKTNVCHRKIQCKHKPLSALFLFPTSQILTVKLAGLEQE